MLSILTNVNHNLCLFPFIVIQQFVLVIISIIISSVHDLLTIEAWICGYTLMEDK